MNALARLPRQALILLVKAYQSILSPHFPGSCNFTPTCSAYAVDALNRYGAIKGTILAIHRISRCHPWGGHGYDPPVWYGERQEDGRRANQHTESHP